MNRSQTSKWTLLSVSLYPSSSSSRGHIVHLLLYMCQSTSTLARQNICPHQQQGDKLSHIPYAAAHMSATTKNYRFKVSNRQLTDQPVQDQQVMPTRPLRVQEGSTSSKICFILTARITRNISRAQIIIAFGCWSKTPTSFTPSL